MYTHKSPKFRSSFGKGSSAYSCSNAFTRGDVGSVENGLDTLVNVSIPPANYNEIRSSRMKWLLSQAEKVLKCKDKSTVEDKE